MTEKRRAPIEVLERLAEALADWSAPGYFPMYQTNDPHAAGHNRVAEALAAYRAAVAPLRTVSEIIREWQRADPGLKGGTLRELVEALDREETEPNALTDHDADRREERCSCEESTALHGRLRRIHQLTLTYDLTSREGAVTAIQAIRKACDE